MTPKTGDFSSIDANSLLIDTGLYRPGHAACYMIHDGGEVALVDTGTPHSLPHILDALAHIDAKPEQVRYVMPTHVHLDHASGSGQVMEAFPNATLVAHPKGLPHLIDPSKLQAGATAVYGAEAFERDFGNLQPVPAARAVAAQDGQRFALGQRYLRFLDTPGHANHHGCIFDETSALLYTGDTFGLGYRELRSGTAPLLVATTTPVAFDPDAWFNSLESMMAVTPRACCLTHFGAVEHPDRLVDGLRRSIQAHVDIALDAESRPADGWPQQLREAVDELLVNAATSHCDIADTEARTILAGDIELNAQGLEIWLKRRAKRREA